MRVVGIVLGALLAGFGGLLALLFYDRYWRWRDCFNELGRCYDEVSQQVYLEQAGGIYATLAALFLILGLGMMFRSFRRHRVH